MLKKLLSFVLIFAVVLSAPAGVIPDGGNVVCAATSKVWNGKTDTKWYTGDLDYYEISTAEQLAGLAELVNNGTNFSGTLICLTKDIALNKTTNFKNWDKKKPAHQWTMIGSNEHPFCGTFNGQGHTISGLYIKDTETYSNWVSTWYTDAGLFGYVSGASIVNVKIKNAYLNVLGTIGTISAYSQNSNFYGIEINNVKLLSGTAGGIVGKATYDYTETWMNLFTVAATEAILACGGVIINPLLFGDALKLPNDFEGNIFYSCKVKNLKCLDTKTTGGLVATGGSSDSGIGCANCLVMNYSVKSDGTKGIVMGVQPNENYAVIRSCFSTDSSIDKKSANRVFIDKKGVKTLKKKTLYRSGASKLGKAFKKVKRKEPQLKIFTMTKASVDESKYRLLDDGYYTIDYYGGYVTVDGNGDVVNSTTPQKWYLKYREGGFYTITAEDGYALTGTSSNDDIFAQKVGYNEHRFTQKWVIEQREDGLYYIWLKDTSKAVSQFTGGWLFIYVPGTGISLEEGWFEDEDTGHNVVWSITPAQ